MIGNTINRNKYPIKANNVIKIAFVMILNKESFIFQSYKKIQ